MTKTLIATKNDMCDLVSKLARIVDTTATDTPSINPDHAKLAIQRGYITALAKAGAWRYTITPKGKHLLRERFLRDAKAIANLAVVES